MVIGITGGVGCGKSTILNLLENEWQAKIIQADELGHEAMEKGTAVFHDICLLFGDEILTKQGEIDRNKLAFVVYQDSVKLQQLNQIIHPFVLQKIQNQIKEWTGMPLIVVETAIMFETGCNVLCDEIWGVITDAEIRIERLIQSRGYTKEKAEKIMMQQLEDEQIIARCDKILYNNGTIVELQRQLQELLEV